MGQEACALCCRSMAPSVLAAMIVEGGEHAVPFKWPPKNPEHVREVIEVSSRLRCRCKVALKLMWRDMYPMIDAMQIWRYPSRLPPFAKQ